MKKAQVNQIFVYILSIVIIAFVGFLVIQFIGAFTSDAGKVAEKKFFETIESDYDDVYRTFGSEKVLEYRVSQNIREICLITIPTCADSQSTLSDLEKENLKLASQAGDNIVLFDADGILASKSIGDYTISDTGCFCLEPNNGRFELVLENDRNEVFISQD